MWQQNYDPVAGSLGWSALVAAIPIFVLLYALGVKRITAWKSALMGLAAAMLVALFVYRMPAGLMIHATLFGAAFGLFPIGWIVFWAIVLYRVTIETGKFEIIKNSVAALTNDQRLQALLIAFAFGAFIEGASGFGTPVAVAAAMLAGLGFQPFYAAAICLLANTAPVAFGAIATPIVTLGITTGIKAPLLAADIGRICAPVSLFIPAYLIMVMGGWRALKAVLPGAVVCGVAFAVTQFTVSNYFSFFLTDILASLAALVCLVILLQFWRPKDGPKANIAPHQRHTAGEILAAWSPYLLLVIFVSLWGSDAVKVYLNKATVNFNWAGLHNLILRMPPVTPKAAKYAATFKLDILAAGGTACLFSSIVAALLLGMSPIRFVKLVGSTVKQLFFAMVTLAAVLAIAYLMNYSGATATLGLAFAATAVMFPFFSALLGWLGVFLTGSDTSANALFGNLQVVTANSLHLNPVLMAASNSSGGVMGKMISLQSIAVAAAATGMPRADESRLFRFTLKHSIILAVTIGLVVLFYAYAMPGWVR